MFSIFRKNKNNLKERVYLDYASITPIDPRVLEMITKTYQNFPANPSSLYKEGVLASKRLEQARSDVASVLEVHADEIYFTSGGTEGDNLGIVGPIKGFLKSEVYKNEFLAQGKKPHIVSTVIEHPAILEILKHLSVVGLCDVSLVPIDEDGRVNPKTVREFLRPETVLVSVMYVNNEIGTIQPIYEIAKTIRHYKKQEGRNLFAYPYFHTDACQAAVYCSLRVPALGVDILTLDGSKIYGPRGCGALYIRRGLPVEPLLYGGDQEGGMRAGTESLAQIAGFAEALKICKSELGTGEEIIRIAGLRNQLCAHIKDELLKVNVEIKDNGSCAVKVPNNINFCIEGIDAEFAVLKLDANGVAVSSVTSCRSKKEDSSSYVIEALETAQGKVRENEQRGVGDFSGCSKSSLRITLGRFTTKKEIEIAKGVIVGVLKRILELKK
jgi:cysteine desulfurase